MVLLLKNIGYDIPIWTGVARYWPVLLILWGLIKLVDYARWKKAGEPGPLFGAGEVVLLIIVLLSGTALTAAANMSPDFGALFEIANIDLWDITGNSYQFSQHLDKEVPSGSAIEVINRYGNIEISAAETNQISLDVAKTIIARDEAEAASLEKAFSYDIVQEGNRYRVISNYNRDQNSVRGRRYKTSLTLKVPRSATLTVNNRYGNVEISNLTGEQTVRNAFGRVALTSITGNIDVQNKNDTVVVEDVTGSGTVSNEFGRVEVRRLTGGLELRNRNGSVEVEQIQGDTKLTNSFGETSVADVKGSLNVDSRMGSVEASRVAKDVNVRNQFQSVRLDDVQGSIDVDNRNGSVDVKFTQPPKNNVRISSRFSDISVVIPSGSSFSVDARSRFSSISTDYSELTASNEAEKNTLIGRVGSGGPDIHIDNQNGNIHLGK
jgi:hypothetical protein